MCPVTLPSFKKNKDIFNNIDKQNVPTLKMAKVQQLKCLFLAHKFLFWLILEYGVWSFKNNWAILFSLDLFWFVFISLKWINLGIYAQVIDYEFD